MNKLKKTTEPASSTKLNNDYRQWLIDLKTKIRQSQIKAAVRVNVELLRLYWDMGQDIVVRQMETVWGSEFFERLGKDLRSEFPHMKGFSVTNLKYCKYFYQFYTQDVSIQHQIGCSNRQKLVDDLQNINNKQNIIHQQFVDELQTHPVFRIPWGHHILIFTKCKSVQEAIKNN